MATIATTNTMTTTTARWNIHHLHQWHMSFAQAPVMKMHKTGEHWYIKMGQELNKTKL
jgi:hypothetical protein